MVRITELMQYCSRRKVEQIAKSMGFEPAEEYPEAVLTAVIRQAEGDPSTVSERAQTAASQTTGTVSEADLQQVQQAAENRAAGLLVAMDALTMMHCATREFSDPQLQKAVNESQGRLKQVLTGFADFYRPDNFLAQTPLGTMKLGGNGSMNSTTLPDSAASLSEPIDAVADSSVG